MFLLLLHQAKESQYSAISVFLGRASYHLFFLHWTAGAALVAAFNLERGNSLLVMSVAGCLVASSFFVRLELTLEPLRRRIASRRDVSAKELIFQQKL